MPVVISSGKRTRDKKIDTDAGLIQTSLKRFRITTDAESELRRQALEDLTFSIGTGQWDASVKANREIEGKPCLTLNRIPTFLRQHTGEVRQHRPAMIVSPVGNGATASVATIHQGVLRHIEVASFADTVYDDAYDMMLRIGWCPGRVDIEYTHEMSFDQEPRINGIENPFSTYLSPVRKPNGTDPLWAHVVQDMSKEEYEEKHPDSVMAGFMRQRPVNFPSLVGNAEPEWVTRAGVRVAEYWWLELAMDTLCLLPDGSTHLKTDLAKDLIPHIEDERQVLTRKVCWCKHNAVEVLDREEYRGKYIPIFEVNGVRLNVNGKIYKCGLVRDARDAQRIYDFHVTRAVEQVDMYSKDPVWIPEGNANHEEEYRQMNRKNFPYMLYKARTDDGHELPPPFRMGRETPIQAMQTIVQQADYDMKSIIGIYGTGPGEAATPNESAFAVLTRQRQTDTGMVNWSDNLNRAIRDVAKILVDLWPKYIRAARVQRIVNPDDTMKHQVVFNSELSDRDAAEALLDPEEGMTEAYDVGAGLYDVTLSSGPQYSTARQEGFRALTVMVTQKPDLLPIMGDVLFGFADWPGAKILADRFRKMLPPQLQEQSDTDKDSQIANLQNALTSFQQQHQQLVVELNRAQDDIRTNRLKLESNERVALGNNLTQLILQRMKSSDAAAQATMDAQIQSILMRLQLLHSNMSVEQEAGAGPSVPELPAKVEPRPQPVTPAQPVQPIPGTAGTGGAQ